ESSPSNLFAQQAWLRQWIDLAHRPEKRQDQEPACPSTPAARPPSKKSSGRIWSVDFRRLRICRILSLRLDSQCDMAEDPALLEMQTASLFYSDRGQRSSARRSEL